ncbi:MAG: hypothetical protein KatS3mg087_0423 [Patescibacteria group bacterium]|nr:MAG: hypothetical protein KatS3mg087_0423 [Patescibacteria group bacterium]
MEQPLEIEHRLENLVKFLSLPYPHILDTERAMQISEQYGQRAKFRTTGQEAKSLLPDFGSTF